MQSTSDRSQKPATARARTLGATGLLGVLTVVHTWPLAMTPAVFVQRHPDVSTGMWALTEMARQVVHDPLHLMNGSIYYPFPNTLAVLDHQLINALLATPLVIAGAGTILVYNAVVLASFFLSALFTYLLVRRLTGSEAAGLVAGCAFAFGAYRIFHLPQSHLLATQWLPLALLALHGYLERPTWRRWALFAAATLLVAFSSWHIAIIGALGIGVVALWSMVAHNDHWRTQAVGLLVVAAVCAVTLLPLASSYAQMGRQWPPRTGEGRETMTTLAGNSANAVGLLARPLNARLAYTPATSGSTYGRPGVFPGLVVLALWLPALMLLWRARSTPTTLPTRFARWWLRGSTALLAAAVLAAASGPVGEPVVALLRPLAPLALFGLALATSSLLAARRVGRDDATAAMVATYAALAIGGALLALGPRFFVGPVDAGSGLWRLDLLPLRLIVRAPARLSLLLTLGASVLAGIGMARLLQGRSRTVAMALTAAVLVALNVDLSFRMTRLHAAPEPGQVDAWLADSPEEGAVIEYPLKGHIWAVYASQQYRRRIVNGEGYLFPWEFHRLEDEPDFSREQLDFLWEHFHPRFVVVRSGLYPRDRRRSAMERLRAQPEALQLRQSFGSDFVYELFDRGRDTEMYRSWPRPELTDKRAIEIQAVVTAGRPGTVGELGMSLNGHFILKARGEEAVSGEPRVASFEPEHVVPGGNEFHIWADYRFTADAEPHPIGSTGVALAADIALRSDRERARVQVNGWVARPDKGYFLVVLDAETGEVTRSGEFNVSWYAEESDALAAFVGEIPAGSPVLVVTEFDASRELRPNAVEALRELGLTVDLRDKFLTMHAAIGVKGAPPGSALEATDRLRATLELGELDFREVQMHSLRLRR